MNKKIDYSNYHQERIIRISDLIVEILHKIWLVIVLAVVFAALLGGYKYMKDKKEAETSTQSVEERAENLNLTDEEIGAVEDLISVNANIEEQRVYLRNSVLMQIDAYNESAVVLQYYVTADGADETLSQALSNGYQEYVSTGALAADMAPSLDLDAQYLQELVSASETWNVNSEAYNKKVNESIYGTFYVTVIGVDQESTEEMADAAQSCIEAYTSNMTEAVGAHSLSLIKRTYANRVDKELWAYKMDRVSGITYFKTQYEELEADLSDTQKVLLESYLSDAEATEDAAQTGGTIQVSFSKKYIALGAAVGLVLACLYIVLVYILRGAINKPEDIEYLYNTRVLGGVNGKKSSALKRLAGGAASPEQQKELLAANVEAACAKKNLTRVLLSGSQIAAADEAVVACVRERLEKCGVHVETAWGLGQSAEALEQLLTADGVILFEQIRHSRYDGIARALKLCEENEVEVLGAVVVE